MRMMVAMAGDAPPPKAVIIDTDCGVDDAAALWWALLDPGLDVLAVTIVWGNVDVTTAATNVLRILHEVGRPDIPVALGRTGPVGPAPDLRPATFIHGDDGIGNAGYPAPPLVPSDEPAADLVRRVCAERPGEVSLVTLGPLSNLADALVDPAWARTVRELVVMGGSARRGGNALPAGEANIAHDPLAARAVVTAGWSRPPLLVGLDVTMVATYSPAELALLDERRTPAAAYLAAPIRFYERYGGAFTAPDCPCHDLVAMLALADPPLITDAPTLPLAVDCGGGPAWGATVVDFRAPLFALDEGARQDLPPDFALWRIALGVDVARFRHHARTLFGGSE
jgi:inosine-uridine nucleoside N-ribohydrolase